MPTTAAPTVDTYIDALPKERQGAMNELRKVIKRNLPKGFKEEISYGMIGYVVPHSIYPPGYHCDPKLPLPFLNIASQKHFVAVYHMGLYAQPDLLHWFTEEWNKRASGKLDMGKSCIRFKKLETIPYPLIGELAAKMTPEDWIACYEQQYKNARKK